MHRLSNEELANIKSLSQKGLSLRQISEVVRLPLSTIQYHISKNNKKPRTKEIVLPQSKFIQGELIGAFAGDGNYYHDTNGRGSHHRIKYCLSYESDKKYAEYLQELIKRVGLNPWIFIKNKNGKPTKCEVTFYSINFLNFIKNCLYWKGIKTYSVCLRNDVSHYGKKFLFGFVRGAMDTDGSVTNSNVRFGVTSKMFTKNLQEILKLINITTTIKIKKKRKRKDIYAITINKKYLGIYNRFIGFSNIRKQQKLLKIINKDNSTAL